MENTQRRIAVIGATWRSANQYALRVLAPRFVKQGEFESLAISPNVVIHLKDGTRYQTFGMCEEYLRGQVIDEVLASRDVIEAHFIDEISPYIFRGKPVIVREWEAGHENH